MAVVTVAAISVAGCGGGGGSNDDELATCGTMLHPDPCPQGNGTGDSGDTVTPASMVFNEADTTNIALKGTGGVGRQEFSTLSFTVVDAAGQPVPGVVVDFTFADSDATVDDETGAPVTTGGLTLQPASAKTDDFGVVSTVVKAGTVPTSIRVVASTDGDGGVVSTVSDLLVVSSGVADQDHFSIAITDGNCEGLNVNQECLEVTATVGDHFGNTVPDGTAVSFTTEGGVIEPSCLTEAGRCSVRLFSANPRTADGRVSILAYALGEESFFDSNGNNVYEEGEPFVDQVRSVFRDDDENGAWSTGEPCVDPTDYACLGTGDGIYTGVLGRNGAAGLKTLYVWDQALVFFSGSYADITFSNSSLSCAAGERVNAITYVRDVNGNPMPSGTTIAISSETTTVAPTSYTVPSVVIAVGSPVPSGALTYPFTVTCPDAAGSGSIVVEVTTPFGGVSRAALPVTVR